MKKAMKPDLLNCRMVMDSIVVDSSGRGSLRLRVEERHMDTSLAKGLLFETIYGDIVKELRTILYEGEMSFPTRQKLRELLYALCLMAKA